MQQFSFYFLCTAITVLSLCISTTANPISSPEINSNSVKNDNNHNSFQPITQDGVLNSFNNYISSLTSAGGDKAPFKPSYKLQNVQNNFVPLQNSNSHSETPSAVALTTSDVNTASATSINNGTPLLMQYMPQMMREGGIQYLQLIPTHPLIVPISPYISTGSNPTAAAYHTPEIQANNALSDYAGQSATIYATNNQAPASTNLVNIQSNIPLGMQSYASNLQNYRNAFRINREIREQELPNGMSLNMNEYIPINPDALSGLYIRGRP